MNSADLNRETAGRLHHYAAIRAEIYALLASLLNRPPSDACGNGSPRRCRRADASAASGTGRTTAGPAAPA